MVGPNLAHYHIFIYKAHIIIVSASNSFGEDSKRYYTLDKYLKIQTIVVTAFPIHTKHLDKNIVYMDLIQS